MNNPADYIKSLRKRLGLSQNDLAKIAGVSWISIQKIEAGQMQPTVNLFKKIIAPAGMDISCSRPKVDWLYLRAAGVPLMETDQVVPHSKIDAKIATTKLLTEIRHALTDEEPRRRKALLAFLLAAKMHYPIFYKKLKCDPLKFESSHDLIKLKRLALARMAHIL